MGAENLKSTEVDLPERREIRLILPGDRRQELFALLSEGFQEVCFSDRSITRTIYFNNQNHEVPWGYSLKARQYLPQRSLAEGGLLDKDQVCLVEIKGSIDRFSKSKTRFEMTLEEASQFLRNNVPFFLTQPLVPVVADEYERHHFRPIGSNGKSRITCDINPSYFLIDQDLGVHFLDEELSVRVELKTALGQETPQIDDLFLRLQDLGARKSVSKKVTAYSFEKNYYKSSDGLPQKELTDMEIESKLVVVDEDPSAFFNRLVRQMRDGIGDFIIQETFPNIVESGSLNSYYEGSTAYEGIKFLSRATAARPILKSQSEIAVDEYGLSCILKRSEVKEDYFPLERFDEVLRAYEEKLDTSLKLVGVLERLRKAFWVINQKTRRVYHVSIDRCREDEGEELYELEVEYSGIKAPLSANPEPEIIADIANLTKGIIDANPSSVRPEPLTKFEWVSTRKA